MEYNCNINGKIDIKGKVYFYAQKCLKLYKINKDIHMFYFYLCI